MKKKQILFFGFFGFFLLFFSSCGTDSETYSEAYGFVKSDSIGNLFVNTSTGYSITWNGISNELHPDSCIKVSCKIDYSTLNGAYNATDVNYTKITQCKLSNDVPSDNDSISACGVTMLNPYLWFGDRWFIGIICYQYAGQSFNPKFYYSSDNINKFISNETDSIIIDVRMKFTGTATSSTINGKSQEFAVDLSPLRSMINETDTIPICFRYYKGKTASPTYSAINYMLKSKYSN